MLACNTYTGEKFHSIQFNLICWINYCRLSFKTNPEQKVMTQYSQPPILTEEFDPDKAEPSLTVEGDVVLKVFNKEFSYPLIITLMAENLYSRSTTCLPKMALAKP